MTSFEPKDHTYLTEQILQTTLPQSVSAGSRAFPLTTITIAITITITNIITTAIESPSQSTLPSPLSAQSP